MTFIAAAGILALALMAMVPITGYVVKTLAQAMLLGAAVGAIVVLILLF
jgi:hypothetical protein